MMKRSMLLIVGLLACLGSATAFGAEKKAGPGIKVGAKGPSINLEDQNGKKWTLADLSGQKKKVALVFYRSADW
ncbi:MAG: hypothetical protein M2R45_00712 [Verrucomicrobia subdivision 3 bacterium]|nr:hypothetical protein [Limisphaerales bacterium]MCS1414405.1 hypothetical protein [Limisphaerales bacterium]